MKKNICGPCAKKTGLPLEERIEIALSAIEGEKYSCSVCFKVQEVLRITGRRKVSLPKVIIADKPIFTPRIKKQEFVKSDIEQLSFFDTADHIVFH